jgi:DNA-binding NarL/FixJ family response regulator
VEDDADPPGGAVGERLGHRRLLVVDDHAVVGVGLRALLGRQPWVERCLTAVDVGEALELARRYEPHLALVDLFIGAESGLELCRALQRVRPGMAVLLMSGGGRVAPAVARAAGAVGFVSKTWAPEALLEAARRAAGGRLVFEARGAPAPTAANLTDRELDVLQQLAAGASNPEAAEALHLSPHTVKQHTSSVYRKLGARNRTDAVRCAQRLGLVY